jgi:hypothetical protein
MLLLTFCFRASAATPRAQPCYSSPSNTDADMRRFTHLRSSFHFLFYPLWSSSLHLCHFHASQRSVASTEAHTTHESERGSLNQLLHTHKKNLFYIFYTTVLKFIKTIHPPPWPTAIGEHPRRIDLTAVGTHTKRNLFYIFCTTVLKFIKTIHPPPWPTAIGEHPRRIDLTAVGHGGWV